MTYHLVVCGGTFDHWHAGHASFIRSVLASSDKVLLGITSDTYVAHNKKSVNPIQSLEQRKANLELFLAQEKALDRVTIAPIDTLFYPEAWERLPIEAIIVTSDTEKGAGSINNDREERGLSPLPIVVVPIITDDTGEKLASTNIRQGKINTEGVSYINHEWFSSDLFLPEVEKQWFKKPFGRLYIDGKFISQEDPSRLVTVGDAVTQDCNTKGIQQKLSVIDFAIQRKKLFHEVSEIGFSGKEQIFEADNPASHITTSLVAAISQAVAILPKHQQIIIIVHGEEDLAVIPLVLSLPLDFILVYGQPNAGIVRLPITLDAKDHAYALLQRFILAKNNKSQR